MPIFDFECPRCEKIYESFFVEYESSSYCPDCSLEMKKLPSLFGVVVSGNIGPKLKTRFALDDELRRQGFSTPLFSNEEHKDKTRWMAKKVGLKV